MGSQEVFLRLIYDGEFRFLRLAEPGGQLDLAAFLDEVWLRVPLYFVA